MKHGIVTEISGPVVDVRFAEGELPSINEALTLTAEGRTYTMEVEQHLTGDTVLCMILSGSMDEYPEAAFFNAGTIDDVKKRAEQLRSERT